MNEEKVNIKIKEESNKFYLHIKELTSEIVIDLNNKTIMNIKSFFEELIIKSFLDEEIYLIDIPEKEVEKLNALDKDLIGLINEFKNQYVEHMKKEE